MTLQAQDDDASNLYWRLVRRHRVKRDWNKITGCESRSEEVGHGPEERLGSRICHSMSVLARIAPSYIRRAMASRTERTRQTTAQRRPLNGHLGVVPRLNSRKSFIKCYEPINTTAKAASLELWRERLEPLGASVHLNTSDANTPSLCRLPLDNLEGTQSAAYTGWSVKSEHVKVGIFKRPMQKRVTVASGRPCNIYIMMDAACILLNASKNSYHSLVMFCGANEKDIHVAFDSSKIFQNVRL